MANNSVTAQHEAWVENRLAALLPDPEWQPDVNRGLALLQAHRRSVDLGGWRRSMWLGAVVAVIGVACIFPTAWMGPRVLAQRCIDCSLSLWERLADSGSVKAANLVVEKDRKPAPDFTLEDADGKSVTLSSLKGRVVLLNFWATWCGGCKVEIPWFVAFEKKYTNRGLAIVGVSMDDDGWKSVRPFLAQHEVNYPIVIGNDNLGKQFGLKSMPMTLLIDRNGKIAATHAGLIAKDDYQAEIEALLKPSLR